MIWSVNKGNFETIKSMSNSKIKSNLNYLYKTSRTDINNHSVPYWIMNLKSELDRRKQLGNIIINRFPYLRGKLNEIKYNIKYKN